MFELNTIIPPSKRFYLFVSGDFSREEDRHLMSAEIPSIRPDVLIGIVYTYCSFRSSCSSCYLVHLVYLFNA